MAVIFDPFSGRLSLAPAPSGGSSVASEQDVFTATEGQTVYPLSFTVRAGSAVVTINGLTQSETEYVASGNVLTFNDGTGIIAGDIIIVSYLR